MTHHKVVIGDAELYHGNCMDILLTFPDNSIDSIVTDPPYGLSFMGKQWDYDVPGEEIWRECLRVLKPGGHLLAFAGTRTQHRMAVRIEDAGFEIRDMIAWVYGSGFPKSMDVSKAIDKTAPRTGMFDAFAAHFSERLSVSGKTQKEVAELFPSKTGGVTGCVWNWANGANVPTSAQWRVLQPLLGLSIEWLPLIERLEAEREVVGRSANGIAGGSGKHAGQDAAYGFSGEYDITAPATDAAHQWQGWGTALKPALEPVTVARKPLGKGTVAANVLAHGTGAINIDGCRVPGSPEQTRFNPNKHGHKGWRMNATGAECFANASPLGRWPANLIHDGSQGVLDLFPDSKGQQGAVTGAEPSNKTNAVYRQFNERTATSPRSDTGSAARFFYCAKASKRDRDEGLEHMPKTSCGFISNTSGQHMTRREADYEVAPRANNHPTVKPTDLMRYLCRLVTPPGGTVLDPFAGSGSTGKAAVQEGFRFIGIEREREYVEIACGRIKYANQQANF